MNDAQRMRNTVILITGEGMGRGDLELQRALIGKYLSLLAESDLLPNSICLYTDGVKLAITGSPVLDQLHALEQRGVRLILCSTCLTFYNLTDQVQVGIIGGMTDILTAQVQADRVITL
jgi:sulfur relay (sulfurtransferase) complex TusBCD TusD component (DsrE family)